MLTIVSPAPRFALLSLAPGLLASKGIGRDLIRAHGDLAVSYALLDDGLPLAAVFYHPPLENSARPPDDARPGGPVALDISARPPDDARPGGPVPNTEEIALGFAAPEIIRPRLVEIALKLRLTMRWRRETGVEIFCAYVRDGHEPGRRMARMAGMRQVPSPRPGFERWQTWRQET